MRWIPVARHNKTAAIQPLHTYVSAHDRELGQIISMSATAQTGSITVEDNLGTADGVAARHTARWALCPAQVLTIAGFCILFLYHNYLPLFHSDLWGHVAYGDWMLQHRQLPGEDPFVELAAGVPVLASAWLSQVCLAGLGGHGEPEQLAHLFAVLTLSTYLILFRTYWVQTRRQLLAAAGATAAFVIAWSRHAVQRPEHFGLLCFAALLWCIVRSDRQRRSVAWTEPLAVGGLFTMWANLHGSFVVGFAVLGCWVVGRGIDVALLTGRSLACLRDSACKRRLVCLEAALIGSCLNPYGVDLLIRTLLFPAHPNLNSVVEWYPLEIYSLEGLPMAASWVFTAFVLRFSRRRMSAVEVLWLLMFNAAVCLRVRMIAWYAPVWVLALWPHVAEMLDQLNDWEFANRWQSWCVTLRRRSPVWTAVSALLVWTTFAFSPISRPILGGPPRRADQIFSHETPLDLTRHLNQDAPLGLVFAPQWWGDWLVWQGPDGLQVMVTTNAIHLLPSRVWQDYLTISLANAGWERALDRYRINTVIASIELQPELCRALHRSSEWRISHEDDVGLVAIRSNSRAAKVERP